jgi:hypothetical protein
MTWRDALATDLCWAPWDRGGRGGALRFLHVAGHRPDPTKPNTWCSHDTARTLAARAGGTHGVAIAIGAGIPPARVICDDVARRAQLETAKDTARLGVVAIIEGFSLTKTPGGLSEPVYSEDTIKIAEPLGSATEREIGGERVFVLFGWFKNDLAAYRAINPRPELDLILEGDFFTGPSAPVSETELAELRMIDAATLASVIGMPPTAETTTNFAAELDELPIAEIELGWSGPEPVPKETVPEEPAPPSAASEVQDIHEVDVDRVAQAIYDTHPHMVAVVDDKGVRHAERRTPPWEAVSIEVRDWVLKQATAAVNATLEQLHNHRQGDPVATAGSQC